MKIFKLPDLGEGLPDAEIVEWHVNEGDQIKTDQAMVSMETAKAVVEVPAPRDGVVAKLYGKAGDIIKTGAPLVEFTDGEASAQSTPTEALQEDAATVVGAVEVGNTLLEESATGVQVSQQAIGGINAIPAVRKMAQGLGIDLSRVQGSGSNGRITAADVQSAFKHKDAQVQVAMPSTPSNASQEPVRGVRRAMAQAMALSHREIAAVTINDDADIHAWNEGNNITLRIIRALVTACSAQPELNAWFDNQKMTRTLHGDVNIGIAMDSSEGLFVPVLQQAHSKNAVQIREAINHFKQQVAERTLEPRALQGATIMLSNFGTFAGRYANPMINPPCVAIIGTGRLRKEVVMSDSGCENHRIIPLSITIDHRAVTGGEAARFLAAMINDLAKPE